MNIDIKKQIEYSKGGILSKVIYKKEKADITLFCMAERTEISEHTSSKEAFVYVLEGEGIFFLGKEEIKMTPGVFISIEKNAKHSLKAEKNTSFMLFLTN